MTTLAQVPTPTTLMLELQVTHFVHHANKLGTIEEHLRSNSHAIKR